MSIKARRVLLAVLVILLVIPVLVPFKAAEAYSGETPTYIGSGAGSGVWEVKFLQSGTWNIPYGIVDDEIEILVVGGGGGGGAAGSLSGYLYEAGGGGGGGLVYVPGHDISGYSNPISVIIGAGGAGASSSHTAGTDGQDSSFGTLTAKGGGGGAGTGHLYRDGKDGGSGGGAGYVRTSDPYYYYGTGGTGTQPSQAGESGTYGYGRNGGTSSVSSQWGQGGGGAGGNPSDRTGGAGLAVWGTTYAKGGDGGQTSSGGILTNTGNGGNGRRSSTSSAWQGGSGIVVIRYTIYVPQLDNRGPSTVGSSTATLNGEITDLGTSTVTERGFVWGTVSGGPYPNSWSEVSGGFSTGTFSRSIASLNPGTMYYFRAFAVNTAGTGYSEESLFLTKPLAPTGFTAVSAGSGMDANLNWTKGTGADDTLIRHKVGSYPTNRSDGSQVYFSSGNSHTHADAGAGTHFYRAWSYTEEAIAAEWWWPLSHTANGWTDPGNAYDGNTTTSSTYSIALKSWSPWIELHSEHTMLVDRVRLYSSRSSTDINSMQVEVGHSEGDWTQIYSGAPSVDAYVTYTFGAYLQVDQVRVRYYNNASFATRTARVHDAQFYVEGLAQFSDSYAEASVYLEPILALWFEYFTMIDGTTLPDSSGGDHHGTITWGSNPMGVDVTVGSLLSPTPYDDTLPGTDTHRDVLPPINSGDWFQSPDISVKLVNHPFRPIVTLWSDNSSLNEVQVWRFLGLVLVVFLTAVAAVLLRGHYLIAGLVCAGTIGLLAQQTVWPFWALVFIVPAVVAGIIAERTPSI